MLYKQSYGRKIEHQPINKPKKRSLSKKIQNTEKKPDLLVHVIQIYVGDCNDMVADTLLKLNKITLSEFCPVQYIKLPEDLGRFFFTRTAKRERKAQNRVLGLNIRLFVDR